jgi:TonB family protein
MSKIKNVSLEFKCSEKLDQHLFCSKCSNVVIDFTKKESEDLEKEINISQKPVCGIFNKSQLSEAFLKYAASTFVATSLVTQLQGQEINFTDLIFEQKQIEFDIKEHMFLGFVVQDPATPLGGYNNFINMIGSQLNYPPDLTEKYESLVEFTVDASGQMRDIKLKKGCNVSIDAEALRVVTSLNHPFTPAKQGGKPIKTRITIPILFDPDEKRRLKII